MMLDIDFAILDFIRQYITCPFLDALAPIVTSLGNGGSFWILLTVIFLLLPKTRKCGIAMALALLLDVLLCNAILKPLIARPRPFSLRDISLIVKMPTDHSFPSGHAAASFAAAGAMAFMKNRGRIPALILASLIALSRLYLYVHYPSDVLGGMLLGLFCGYTGSLLVKQLSARGGNLKKQG